MSMRTVLFMRDKGGYGWSEDYNFNSSVTPGTIPSAINALISARMACSTTDISCTHLRIVTAISRLPVVFTLNGGAGVVGTQPPPTAPSEVAILIRFNAGLAGYNRVFLRGIP